MFNNALFEEAEHLCDNIAIINNGKKIIEGTKKIY